MADPSTLPPLPKDHLDHPEQWTTGSDPATSKQKGFIKVLEKQHPDAAPPGGIDVEVIGKSEASEVIDKLKNDRPVEEGKKDEIKKDEDASDGIEPLTGLPKNDAEEAITSNVEKENGGAENGNPAAPENGDKQSTNVNGSGRTKNVADATKSSNKSNGKVNGSSTTAQETKQSNGDSKANDADQTNGDDDAPTGKDLHESHQTTLDSHVTSGTKSSDPSTSDKIEIDKSTDNSASDTGNERHSKIDQENGTEGKLKRKEQDGSDNHDSTGSPLPPSTDFKVTGQSKNGVSQHVEEEVGRVEPVNKKVKMVGGKETGTGQSTVSSNSGSSNTITPPAHLINQRRPILTGNTLQPQFQTPQRASSEGVLHHPPFLSETSQPRHAFHYNGPQGAHTNGYPSQTFQLQNHFVDNTTVPGYGRLPHVGAIPHPGYYDQVHHCASALYLNQMANPLSQNTSSEYRFPPGPSYPTRYVIRASSDPNQPHVPVTTNNEASIRALPDEYVASLDSEGSMNSRPSQPPGSLQSPQQITSPGRSSRTFHGRNHSGDADLFIAQLNRNDQSWESFPGEEVITPEIEQGPTLSSPKQRESEDDRTMGTNQPQQNPTTTPNRPTSVKRDSAYYHPNRLRADPEARLNVAVATPIPPPQTFDPISPSAEFHPKRNLP